MYHLHPNFYYPPGTQKNPLTDFLKSCFQCSTDYNNTKEIEIIGNITPPPTNSEAPDLE